MSTLRLKYGPASNSPDGSKCITLPQKDFTAFSPLLLGLGDISKEGTTIPTLAVIFDLEGFTDFTNQPEPNLVLPEYLNEFLKWLFDETSSQMVNSHKDGMTYLWSPVPFYAKFLGDGILFLWDTTDCAHSHLGNIIVSMHNICTKYQRVFYPIISQAVSKAPAKLRCGSARGQVISVGNGNDFVGACINVASRVQHLNHFSFAFSKTGFKLERDFSEGMRKKFQLIRANIRGIGEKELIFVLKQEFEALDESEQKLLLS